MRSLLSGAAGLLLVGVAVVACSSGPAADDPSAADTEAGTPEGAAPIVTGPDGSVITPQPGADGGTPGADAGPPAPTCTDKKKNGSETDIDCGGSCATKCPVLEACALPADCATGLVCVKKTCSSPAANDGLQDGTETDIDCGGSAAPACDVGKGCVVGADCTEKVCNGTVCLAPTPTDGVQNGTETDVDCGGDAAPPCGDNKKCKVAATDCTSLVCTGDVCQAPLPTDGVKNGNETDIDCGGGAPAPACGSGKACSDGTRDCDSFVCTGNVCQAATGTDGVKNGDESDVDCGGTTTGAPKCDPGSACGVHADCKSDGCDYNGKCAIARSCTKHNGGDTCGTDASQESCCTTAPLAGSAVKIDKYLVSAGRMRTFIERTSGNARGFATTTTGWNAAWSPYVPSTTAEANMMLGAYWNGAANDSDGNESKRSCQPNGFGGHSYYTPADGVGDYNQAQLDPKALNCVGWHIAKAFCAWDGGRLATRAEIANAFTNNNANSWPWEWRDATAYDPNVADNRLNHQFNYGAPGAPRMVSGTVQDVTWFISPPGRFPLGANANGVQDIAGDLLHWTSDGEYFFTWTESWERHGKSIAANSNWKTDWPGQPNGYYAIGFRCAH